MIISQRLVVVALLLSTLLLLSLFIYSKDFNRGSVTTIVKMCRGKKDADFCYAKAFALFAEKHSFNETRTVLAGVQKQDSKANGCHFIAHGIAAAEVRKRPDDWKAVMADMPLEQCTGGFIMGVLEAQKLKDKTFVLNKRTIPNICQTVKESPSGEMSCVHVLGHLVLVEKKGNVHEAVSVCSSLKEASHECYAGVFMESITRENLVQHRVVSDLDWDEETVIQQKALCTSFTDDAYDACWRELSHMFVYVTKASPEKVYEHCEKGLSSDAQNDCSIHAAGLMVLAAYFDQNELGKVCSPYADRGYMQDRCITMVVKTLSQSSSSSEVIQRFCNAFSSERKETCTQLAST